MDAYRPFTDEDTAAFVELFVSVFADSEGTDEGELIGALVAELVANTPAEDLLGFVALDAGHVVGGLLLSRLTFEQPIRALLLSPVAIRTSHQGQGFGQQLIHYALEAVRRSGVQLVVTYGDPAFYGKTGFRRISTDAIEPPLPLSQPEGWLAQSLTTAPLESITGKCKCVRAFDNPQYW